MDYSENIINIDHLRRQAHDELLKKNWSKVIDIADEIIVASRGMRGFCLAQLDLESEYDKHPK